MKVADARRRMAWLSTVALLALGGCGGEESDTAGEPSSKTTPSGPDSPGGPGAGQAQAGSDAVEVFFTEGEQFAPVERELSGPAAKPRPVVEALLEGPADAADAETQIPEGVALRDLTITESGTAVVKLSDGFTKGIPAAAAKRTSAEDQELDARLGQVIYTLSQFDQVNSARVLSGGTVVSRDLETGDYAKPDRGPRRVQRPRGARRAGTRQIQQRLADLGYLPAHAVDGLYGYRTTQAVIAFQSWEGLDRDGVAGPITTAALADARRPRPSGAGPRRRIEVHREKGVALLVRGGRTIRAIHISSGAPGTSTPSGSYRVFRKELRSWSVPFSVWLPYASYFNQGIAFHEYPDVPTYPASHGCVRVPAPEARVVYRFAELDTAVVVI